MSNLDKFCKQVLWYLNQGGKTQQEFADKLGMNRAYINRILHRKDKMPDYFVPVAITALAELRCLRGKEQALKLLELTDTPDFPPEEWEITPLVDLEEAQPKSLAVNSERSTSQIAMHPDSPPQIWLVPYHRNPYFTGRDDILEQLDQLWFVASPSRQAVLTQVLKGLGGIGKTQIAVEYAYRSREKETYTHILWINAASAETMIASFIAVAELIPALSAQHEKDQSKLVAAVIRWLEESQHPWLLIVDNADELIIVPEYLPHRGNGSILLTTRSDHADSLATVTIEIEDMSLMEGTSLLLQTAGAGRFQSAVEVLEKEEKSSPTVDELIDQASNLVIILGHFPLALDQAGAYIASTKCSLTDYQQMYQKHRKELLEQRGQGLQAAEYPNAVATTWSLSFQKVEEANPAAAELLRLCSFLAPDRIPEELIREGAAHWSPLLQQAATDLYAFNQIIKELLRFSLVKRLTETNILSIHRMVQAVQVDDLTWDIQQEWARRVVYAVNAVFPRNVQDPGTWPQCFLYLSQTQACHVLIERYDITIIEAALVLNRIGLYLDTQALYTIAEPLYKHALSLKELLLGPMDPSTGSSLNNLAELYASMSRYHEAESTFQRALEIDLHNYGYEHPTTAITLNNLAHLYETQGKYKEAEVLYQNALDIKEQQRQPDYASIANTINNLAGLYLEQGKYSDAESLFQRSLVIYEQKWGPRHLFTASGLNNLALLYETQGRYCEAEELYTRAIAIREEQLGPDHPSTANSINNLATIYYAQGKYSDAEPLYQRALSIKTQQLGGNHSEIAQNLNNLGELYRKQGKFDEAESLLLRALAIRIQQLGTHHPDTAQSLNNLGALYKMQQKYDEAKPLFQRALAIDMKTHGAEHPEVATDLNNLAVLYLDQGKYRKAKFPILRALRIRQHQLGTEHPLTILSLNTLARFHSLQGDYVLAELLYKQVLDIQQKLSPEHFNTALSFNNLGNLYCTQGKYELAKPLYQQALVICVQQLGVNHPDTITIFESLLSLQLLEKQLDGSEELERHEPDKFENDQKE